MLYSAVTQPVVASPVFLSISQRGTFSAMLAVHNTLVSPWFMITLPAARVS
jgi:hypothetical protein